MACGFMTSSKVQLDECGANVTTGVYVLCPEQQRNALAPSRSDQVEHHQAAGRSSGFLGIFFSEGTGHALGRHAEALWIQSHAHPSALQAGYLMKHMGPG